MLKRAIRQGYQRKGPRQIFRQGTHVTIDDGDPTPHVFRESQSVLPCLRGHLGGLLDTSDIDAGGGNGKQSASRAAASFEDRATRGCRVVPIELNLTIQAGEVAVVEARLGAGVCRVDLEQVLDDGALFLQFLLRRGELATGELTQFETLDDGDIALAV